MAVNSTQQWSAWDQAIESYIQDQTEQEITPLYKELFDTTTRNELQLTYVGSSGYGLMQEVGEQGDAIPDSPLEGYKTFYRRQNYRKSATFTKVLLDTDLTGEVERRARGLPMTVEYSRNMYTTGMFRRAWDTSYTWGDGKPLISLSHPLKDGSGTQENTFTDGVQRPLTYDNALRLEDVLGAMVSNSGNLLNTGATGRNLVLFGAWNLRETLFQIAGVEGPDKQPDTDDNNVNWFRKGAKYDVLVSKFFSYEAAKNAKEVGTITKSSSLNYWDSMWGIMDVDVCKAYNKMVIYEGYPYYEEEFRVKNETMAKYALDAYTFGTSGYFGTVSSKGDNSVYTG